MHILAETHRVGGEGMRSNSVVSNKDKAIIGLCSIAIQHIMDENYDKAEDTLRGLIMTLEGKGEQ